MNGVCLILDYLAQTLKIIKAKIIILDMCRWIWRTGDHVCWRQADANAYLRYQITYAILFFAFYLAFDSSTVESNPLHTGTLAHRVERFMAINSHPYEIWFQIDLFRFAFVFVFAIYRSRIHRNINNWISNESELMSSSMSTKSWIAEIRRQIEKCVYTAGQRIGPFVLKRSIES